MANTDIEKQNAAKASIDHIKAGMIVGLGSGSTSEHMVQFLGKKVKEGLQVKGVPSSDKIAALAKSLGIPLTTLQEVGKLDVYIDGADEVDGNLNMIKGGGGALLREKILAHNADRRIIIVNSSKRVEKLGKFKLPVEVIPFAQKSIMVQLKKMGLNPVHRTNTDRPYITDENNFIIDMDITGFHDHTTLNQSLLSIPGLVETGLFLNRVDLLIVGKGQEVSIYP